MLNLHLYIHDYVYNREGRGREEKGGGKITTNQPIPITEGMNSHTHTHMYTQQRVLMRGSRDREGEREGGREWGERHTIVKTTLSWVGSKAYQTIMLYMRAGLAFSTTLQSTGEKKKKHQCNRISGTQVQNVLIWYAYMYM